MALELREWDTAEHLKTKEDMALFLEACLEEAGDDAAFIAQALGVIAKAHRMNQLSAPAGSRDESLDEALSGEASPSLDTFLKVTKALGLEWRVKQAA